MCQQYKALRGEEDGVSLCKCQKTFLLQDLFLYYVLRKRCVLFLSLCLLTSMSQHAFLICMCVGLCVFSCTVAVCPRSTLGREITSCQPLPVSICCCLLSPGCRPSLSVKGNAVASNPSRGALFDAHWQEPGSRYSGFPCVSKYVCVLLSGEFHTHTGPKQLRCHSDEHWPLFSSNLLPSCSLFELQCAKGNKMQKSFCAYTNGMLTSSWQIIQTKG